MLLLQTRPPPHPCGLPVDSAMPRSGLMMTAAPPWRHMARMILLAAAAAAAALLAAAPAEAATQQPTLGATCGPNDDGEWIKPNKLAASGGGTVGSDGCITAGGGAKTLTPFVRADLLPTTYTLFEVYMASSSSVSSLGGGRGPGGLYVQSMPAPGRSRGAGCAPPHAPSSR